MSHPAPHVILSVTDTGSGMTDEVQRHIFEPFFTTKEEGKGTGLGLATCFGIARQNGGHIQVESELGQGTTFQLYLPRTESAIPATEGRGESDTTGVPLGGTETVLLAEDEPLVRKLVAKVLRDRGYRVMEAGTGQEALEIFQSQEPGSIQMLLTDVVMPQMARIELAQRIKGYSAKYQGAVCFRIYSRATVPRRRFVSRNPVYPRNPSFLRLWP